MNIGFIGLGSMGRPMALNLLEAGHRLAVHDVDRGGRGAVGLRESGAAWAQSPAEAAREAEIVFTSLPGPAEVEAVALGDRGVLEGAAEGSVFIDTSTSSPSLARRLYAIFRERGVHVLDAPVSQGTISAKFEGTLAILVGGDREVFERVRPVLEVLGRDHLIYCGESGAGAVGKLCNNLAALANQAVLAEALTLGVRAGVPVETLVDVICQGSARSMESERFRTDLAGPTLFEDPEAFRLLLGRKDIRLATDLARELDVPAEIANLVEQRMTEAVARGWGGWAVNVQMQLQAQKADVELGPRPG